MRILCFDIGGTFIKYALCNEKFQLSEKQKMPTNAKEGGQAIIQRIIDVIESYDNIDRVAISTAGQVDSKNGIVVYSTDNIPYYTGMMVKSIIENKTGILTYVENDVTLLRWAKLDLVQQRDILISSVLHSAQVSAELFILIINCIQVQHLLPENSDI